MSIETKKCENCQVIDQKLLICTGCRIIYYCGRECQKAHFKNHKLKCLDDKKQRWIEKINTHLASFMEHKDNLLNIWQDITKNEGGKRGAVKMVLNDQDDENEDELTMGNSSNGIEFKKSYIWTYVDEADEKFQTAKEYENLRSLMKTYDPSTSFIVIVYCHDQKRSIHVEKIIYTK